MAESVSLDRLPLSVAYWEGVGIAVVHVFQGHTVIQQGTYRNLLEAGVAQLLKDGGKLLLHGKGGMSEGQYRCWVAVGGHTWVMCSVEMSMVSCMPLSSLYSPWVSTWETPRQGL